MALHKPQLIVALDVGTLEEAKTLVDILSPVVDIFKVGSQLFTAAGPEAVRSILAKKKKIFLDLKYHDIPNTVSSAIEAAVSQGIFMLTVHSTGGRAMLEAAVKAGRKKSEELKVNKPFIVGVTVLTSDESSGLVLDRARLAKEAGLDGVVASVGDVKAIRQALGEDFIIVTPGIRPSGSAVGDQKRVGTPQEAVRAGSNFLVVGRPIIESANPLEAAKKILEEIRSG